MIVDFHIHPAYWESMTDGFVSYLKGIWGDELDTMIRLRSNTEGMVSMLDEAGVDYAVVLAEVSPVTTGSASNELVKSLCKGTDRLIPFCTINPHLEPEPVRTLERLVREDGFRGLKLYPTYHHFYPNEARMYPIYAKAEELQIPVMFHTGSSVFPGSKLKYGNPLLWDDVAVDFPNLIMILCHAGRPFWYDEASFLARLHKNVYLDLSGLPPKRLLQYLPDLDRIRHKVVFGTDFPGVRRVGNNIKDFQQLPLSDEARRMILGDNAARILGLQPREGVK